VDVARKVTQRPEFAAASDDAGRLRALYAILFQRAPNPQETQMAQQFIAQNATDEVLPVPFDAKRARARANKPKGRYPGQGAIRNQGELVERKALTPWELYTQALLFTNEVAYVN
jgi:hypothetical protein